MCPHLFGRNISNWTEKSFAFNVAAVHSRPKYAYRPQTRAWLYDEEIPPLSGPEAALATSEGDQTALRHDAADSRRRAR